MIQKHRKPLHEELISLRRKLALLAQKSTGYTAAEVNEIQEKVNMISFIFSLFSVPDTLKIAPSIRQFET